MPTTTETGPVRRRLHRPPNRPVQVRGSHLKWTKSRGLDIVIVIDHTVDSVGEYTPRLVDGARSCPPEDCGGFPGYDELVGVLADPTHEGTPKGSSGSAVSGIRMPSTSQPPTRSS